MPRGRHAPAPRAARRRHTPTPPDPAPRPARLPTLSPPRQPPPPPPPPQKSREHHFVQIRRNRQHPRQRRRRIGANRPRHRNPALRIRRARATKMLRAMLLPLPVHPPCPLVVPLHAAHPHFPFPGLWIAPEH